MKKIDIVSFIMILALLLFFCIGVIVLYFMITSESEIPFYVWPIPVVFIIFPCLLLKDFIDSFFIKAFKPRTLPHYTSKKNNAAKDLISYNVTDNGATLIINNITVEKKIIIQIIDSGEKLRAIKYLTDTTKIDLLSAKSIIDKFMTDINSQTQMKSVEYANDFENNINKAAIKKLLLEGKKREAVSYVMKTAKIGMGTAKDYIDSFSKE